MVNVIIVVIITTTITATATRTALTKQLCMCSALFVHFFAFVARLGVS